MAAYGKPSAAIAGLLYGAKADVESGIAKENIGFGQPCFGFADVPDEMYLYHVETAKIVLAGALVTDNVITTTIKDTDIATTLDTDHATTMAKHVAAINASTALGAYGVVAVLDTADSNKRTILLSVPKSLDIGTVTCAVTLGATQTTATITSSTARKFMGVAVFVQNGSKTMGAGNACWETGMYMNVLSKGKIYVPAVSTVDEKDAAYVVTSGATQNQFTDDSNSNANYDIGGYFRSSVDSDGLAVLEVRGMK
jgi:hypothetical protein